MQFLKKSTAVDIVVGPFVDDEDGATLKTGLAIAQADVQLSKNAGSFAQKNDATSATHLKDGQYKVPLSTTDTNTNGYMRVSIVMSGCLPVWAEYLIVPANVYDSLVGGSASLDVSATSVRSAVGLGSANLDTQLSGISSKTTNLPGSPAAVGSAMTLSDGAITAAKIASNAITDAKIANNAITGDKVATTAVTKIQSGLATSSALSTVGGNVSAIPTNPLLTNDVRLGNLDAKVSDVKAKTDKIPNQPAPAGEYDTQLDATISSRLAESSYTAPDNAGIGQIQTDIGNLNDITVGDILDGVVEGTYTIQDYLRLMASVLFGKLDGGGTFTLTFRDPDDTTDRVIATVDANANRTDIITNVL